MFALAIVTVTILPLTVAITVFPTLPDIENRYTEVCHKKYGKQMKIRMFIVQKTMVRSGSYKISDPYPPPPPFPPFPPPPYPPPPFPPLLRPFPQLR